VTNGEAPCPEHGSASDQASSCAILLTVAYDGAGFAGFVVQPGQRTVAGELLRAIHALDPRVTKLRASSRTDAGVHARGQRVAFDVDRSSTIPPRGWVRGLIPHLPDSIAVKAAARVPPGFEPRFEAVCKTYRYLLLRAPTPDPFWAGRVWRVPGLSSDAALGLLSDEVSACIGQHHFGAFRSAEDKRDNVLRTIFAASVVSLPDSPALLGLEIRGDGFLHNMVRILVGTAVDVARGQRRPGAIARAIASGDRRDAGITAPPHGLYLERVQLRSEGTDLWPAS